MEKGQRKQRDFPFPLWALVELSPAPSARIAGLSLQADVYLLVLGFLEFRLEDIRGAHR